MSTPHFSLATDMKQEPAEELAHTLEDWWSAMTVAFARIGAPAQATGGDDDAGDDREPLLVIALRSEGEREAVHYQIGGEFIALPLIPPAISIGSIDGEHGREVLKHELAHALLHQRLPRVPRWLTEGIAVYLQLAELDRDRRVASWGALSQSQIRAWSEYGPSVSTQSLLNPARWGHANDAAMEIRAGLLVHMLLTRHADEFRCYLGRLEGALDGDPIADCFPSRASWDPELESYSFESFGSQESPFTPPAAFARAAPMSDASVHAVLGLLDFMVLLTIEERFRPPRAERARQNVMRALELEPDNLLAGLLLLTRTELDATRTDSLTKAIVVRHGGDWRAWVARAHVRGLPAADLQEATARAQALAPNETEVLRLTAAEAVREGRWADARTLGIRAWLGGAEDIEDRTILFVAAAQLGHCEEAARWTRSTAETKQMNAFLLRFQEERDLPKRACGVNDPDLK